MTDKRIDEATGVETVGHSFDGIEELNNPLPRWWLWTFYATIIWGLGYVIAYPAWPMLTGATEGVLGWSTRADVAEAIEAHDANNAELVQELLAVDLASLEPTSDLHRYGFSRGGAVFRAHCSQCHGSGAAGAKGYPNLLDDDWLWGGSMEAIAYSVRHGIRNETDAETRYSEMPAFGEILEEGDIDAVVEYVASLSTDAFDGDLAELGAVIFEENCASCHGENAGGDIEQGAPDLADAIWLYGGDRETLNATVTYSRFGVMPAWGQRLSEADIRAVSTYVHALGGGE